MTALTYKTVISYGPIRYMFLPLWFCLSHSKCQIIFLGYPIYSSESNLSLVSSKETPEWIVSLLHSHSTLQLFFFFACSQLPCNDTVLPMYLSSHCLVSKLLEGRILSCFSSSPSQVLLQCFSQSSCSPDIYWMDSKCLIVPTLYSTLKQWRNRFTESTTMSLFF